MEIIAKTFSYKGKEYLVIKETDDKIYGEFYGTVDHDMLDHGRLRKALRYVDMAIASTIKKALENRMNEIDRDEFIKENALDLNKIEDAIKLYQFLNSQQGGELLRAKGGE